MGINSVGLRRKGYTNEQINHIQDIYRILYLKGYNTTKAIEIIETETPSSSERDEILLFLLKSKKGVMKRSVLEKDIEE